MSNASFHSPVPVNESIKSYAPGTPEREEIKAKLKQLVENEMEIPAIIGGRRVNTGDYADCRMPHNHAHRLGVYHKCKALEVMDAIKAAREAHRGWADMPWQDRASIFLKAAEILAGPLRSTLNAATMLSQSKSVFQAEIDAACELIDFWRFNAYFMSSIYEDQPMYSPTGMWNRSEWRPLEGFVFAVTPFNFTSIAGNLPTAPAMMGNTVVWKPASSAVYSASIIMEILELAGLPPGVINMVPGPGGAVGRPAMTSPELAGIHFTGSTATFREMYKVMGENIKPYRTWPRIVGETGGKDFVFAHPSADVEELNTALVRGAFEYQGQKCSAASRAYVPSNLWPELKETLVADVKSIKMGDVADMENFMGAVIDRPAFESIKGYIDGAKKDEGVEVLVGGKCNDRKGYFIEPTVIEVQDPSYVTMVEEIFGPVLTVYVYDEDRYSETLELCDRSSPYALTGAIFARERAAIVEAVDTLRFSAGNFYINDKPTGAVVGQQPFGGGRASGTNDKAGSMLNLLRWTSPRTIKETFVPPVNYAYEHMLKEKKKTRKTKKADRKKGGRKA